MARNASKEPFAWPKNTALRFIRMHSRLLVSLLFGIAAFVVTPDTWRGAARLLISWDIFAFTYLVSVLLLFAHFDIKRVRARASAQDEGAFLILMLTVLAAIISLAAVVMVLGAAKEGGRISNAGALILIGVTILLSWGLIHSLFALHYAHEFYGEHGKAGPCLAFPNENNPDYWDFAYFSFVIGMTFQVSDVQVTSKTMRRLVILHGIISFFFTVAIIGLTVNIGSGLIG